MNPIINLYVMTSCVFLDQRTHFYSGGTIFLVLMVKLDAIEQILIFIPMEQFISTVRLDPVEQILIFIVKEQLLPMVQLDATNSNNNS